MASHLVTLLLFSFLVSLAFAGLRPDDLKGRFRFGLALFGVLVLSVIVAGWIIYPFPS